MVIIMTKLKNFFNNIMQGFASFTITPDTDYNKYISNDISQKAWQDTGNRLRESMLKIGGKI